MDREAGKKPFNLRVITVTAMLSAVSFVLMFLDFSVPFMPAFIKMDLSELPALIGSFSLGPACGVAVCLVKNLLHLLITTTGGVGEWRSCFRQESFTRKKGQENGRFGVLWQEPLLWRS